MTPVPLPRVIACVAGSIAPGAQIFFGRDLLAPAGDGVVLERERLMELPPPPFLAENDPQPGATPSSSAGQYGLRA
jgi:hypothetical protein